MSPDHSSSKITVGDVLIVWRPRQQCANVLATLLATALLTTTLSVWQVRVNPHAARRASPPAALHEGILMQLGKHPHRVFSLTRH